MKIYVVKVSSLEEAREEELISLVNYERKERIKKLTKREDRFRSIGAGLLLRYSFMKKYRKIEDWECISIRVNSLGKPSIEGKKDFYYSLSHSGEYVGICIDDTDCGLDIQEMKESRLNIARRFFSKEEYHSLCEQSEQRKQNEMFYQMWTAKEGYVKYKGMGLSDGLDRFQVNIEKYYVKDKMTGDIGYIDFDKIDERYMLCLCSKIQVKINKDTITMLSLSQLLEGCYAECDGEKFC